MKTYVAFVRDHSASMSSLKKGAMEDFNLMVEGIKNVQKSNPYSVVKATVVECGVGWQGNVRVQVNDSLVQWMRPINEYVTDGGGTPLWEAVEVAISRLIDVERGDRDNNRFQIREQKSFLVIVTTDGQNNRGQDRLKGLMDKIRVHQATDEWTFVFRVPVGYKNAIVAMGVPEGNVVEWEQNSASQTKTTIATTTSINTYFDNQSRGVTATKSFYTTDLSNVTIKEVRKELDDITEEIDVARVWTDNDGIAIKKFCTDFFYEYSLGKAFYELTKAELVQDNKKIILKHLKKGKYYTGTNEEIRQMLGLPDGNVKIHPGNHGDFEIYVQSTSVNRKLYKNTNVLYWKNA